MSNEPVPHDPGLKVDDVESLLGSLAPSKSGIDRDRVMFLAGRASARPAPQRGWKALAAGLALLASGEAALLARGREPQVIERLVVVREPAAPAAETPLAVAPIPPPPDDALAFGATAHARLAGQVIRYGLDGLPPPAFPSRAEAEDQPRPLPTRQLLREELREALVPGDAL
ncbi:MAG: hypothetical protein U0835_27295 [Isosphaeraceae bacterium]